jgi:hypothetical protein
MQKRTNEYANCRTILSLFALLHIQQLLQKVILRQVKLRTTPEMALNHCIYDSLTSSWVFPDRIRLRKREVILCGVLVEL